MSKALASLSCFILALALMGCSQQNQKLQKQTKKKPFPEIMVGVWEADFGSKFGAMWGIKFEPDGSILKIIHPLAGPVRLAEGGIYEEGPDKGTFAAFSMGPCEANYSPTTHMLKVKIVLDHFQMKLPNGQLEGRMEDHLWGRVSQDGKKWRVKRVNYCWLEGASPPEPNLIKANPEELVFTKIDISQPPPEANNHNNEPH